MSLNMNNNKCFDKKIQKLTWQLQEKTEQARELHAKSWKFERKSRILIMVIIFLSIVIVILLPANHYRIALVLSGHVETQLLREFDDAFFGVYHPMRLILSQPSNELGEFIMMRRTNLGFWAAEEAGVTLESGGILVFTGGTWRNYLHDGWQGFGGGSSSFYYHNINAIALIELDYAVIPHGATATVRQWGGSYLLHLDNTDNIPSRKIEILITALLRDFTE